MSKNTEAASINAIRNAVKNQIRMEDQQPEYAEKLHQAADQAYKEYTGKTEFEKLRQVRADYFRLMNEAFTMSNYFQSRVKALDAILSNMEIPESND